MECLVGDQYDCVSERIRSQRVSMRTRKNVGGPSHAPVLMQRLEFCRHGLPPPLPLQRLCAFAAVPFDDRPVQVEQGEFWTSRRAEVDTMQTRAFGTDRGFDPLKG